MCSFVLNVGLHPLQISLVYANVTEDDILLRKELDIRVRIHPNIRVFYTLNSPPEGGNFCQSCRHENGELLMHLVPVDDGKECS